jgi:hypothetical protein
MYQCLLSSFVTKIIVLMEATRSLTGELPLVIIFGTLLAAITSAFLLWLYKRAVMKEMTVHSLFKRKLPPPTPVINSTDREMTFNIAFTDFATRTEKSTSDYPKYLKAIHSLNQITKLYLIAGAFFATILTIAWIITSGSGFNISKFLLLFLCFSWPSVIVIYLINPIIIKRIVLIYCLAFLLVAIVTLIRNPVLNIGQLLFIWLYLDLPGTILLMFFMNRRIKAVGPVMLAFMVIAVSGSFIFVDLVGNSATLLQSFVNIAHLLGMGAITLFISFFIIGFLLFGLAGWQFLRWIAYRYQKKRISDQSISIDALWLLFGVLQSFSLVFENWIWIFTGIIAFLVYKITLQAGFSLFFQKSENASENSGLLLLRVFSLGLRSEKLFEMISKIFLRNDNINLIAGPDLVTSRIEPHEFLNFISGRLSRQFISDETGLEQHVSDIDVQHDPDGRYRVNEFFCNADTWQLTMQSLALISDVVLMDLRSFSKNNQGCIYEIRQLINSVALDRIVFIVDYTTDLVFLEETVKKLYYQIDAKSPNYAQRDVIIRLFKLGKSGIQKIEKLLYTLYS